MVTLLNKLLPFATPGTPVIQDLVHLAVIATLLYYAPQIQERLRQQGNHRDRTGEDSEIVQEAPAAPDQDVNVVEEQQDQDRAEQEEPANLPDQNLLEGHGEDEPGPANLPNAHAQRNVGAKKAKSLAKRDQRRAYNEFMRSQGEAQRARDAEGAAEREAEQTAERERRRAAAVMVEAKKAKEREQRKEQERSARESEIIRRDAALSLVRSELDEAGMINLFDVASRIGGDADEVWVERVLNAGGVLGWSPDGDRLTLVLNTGWLARVGRNDMRQVYAKAASTGSTDPSGRISFDRIGTLIEAALKGQL